MRRSQCICLAAMSMCAATAICQMAPPAVVAIASGPTLSLYNESGEEVRSVDLKRPIAGFAVSPDRRKLVVVSPDTEHGGALILIDVKSGATRRLTSGHQVFRRLDTGETEVYDSPAFSPDGRSLAFAAHGNRHDDGNDAWENSGPIGVIDLATGKIQVLKATSNIDGNGPCSESDPQWSPDGKWILFNCEDGAFITDARGRALRDLKITSDSLSGSAVGWVGTHCVLYEQVPEQQGHFEFEHEALKVLELNSMRSIDAGKMLSWFHIQEGGIQRASGAAIIQQTNSSLVVATRKREWVLPLERDRREPQTVAGQLLTGWDVNSIPDVCR